MAPKKDAKKSPARAAKSPPRARATPKKAAKKEETVSQIWANEFILLGKQVAFITLISFGIYGLELIRRRLF